MSARPDFMWRREGIRRWRLYLKESCLWTGYDVQRYPYGFVVLKHNRYVDQFTDGTDARAYAELRVTVESACA